MEYTEIRKNCKLSDCFNSCVSAVTYKLKKGAGAIDYKRMNDFRMLGLTIAYYRKLRGMTQADLAEATQLSRTHISNIEAPNGKTSISLNKLFDIAEVLEVPMKDLFDFRDR